MQSSGKTDSWTWQEWLDVALGGEAVDLGDLAGEFEGGTGREMWLSRAELEAGILPHQVRSLEKCAGAFSETLPVPSHSSTLTR